MPNSARTAGEAGRESLQRIGRLIDRTGGDLGRLGADLLSRHGYVVGSDGSGPHRNVLGHPLFELPIWMNQTGGAPLASDALLDICESSLCGYLAVRAEDDYFDRHTGEPEAVMMLAGFFRTRHQTLLAGHVSDLPFWGRFERLWHAYGEAMLLERSLHDPERPYGADEFEAVLQRSQPLEIPGQAVLSMTGRGYLADQLAGLVRHLVRATQLFDDFVDAPDDLAAGNYTWMVRRLGGLQGRRVLGRGMVAAADQVVTEAGQELDRAVELAGRLGIDEIAHWVEARKGVMRQGSERMYGALFATLRGPDD